MLDQTRTEHVETTAAWDRAFRPRFAQALAQTLVDVVSAIENPSIGDLLYHVGEGAYDLDDLFLVPVRVGDLVGQPGEGPTVADVAEAISDLDRPELDVAISQRLASLLSE